MTASPPVRMLADCLARLREGRVRVHALTSPVAAERTANTLLALNVRPSLTGNPPEVAGFVAAADALLVNLGMLDGTREAALTPAIDAAGAAGRPWVLDPVFVDVSGPRRTLAATLLARGPAVLKLNGAEAAARLTAPAGTVIVTTGAIDRVDAGSRRLAIANGHPLASRVTAAGCALGAVIAATCAVERDAAVASAAALAIYGVAAEIAADASDGPGSFGWRLIDALAALDPDTLMTRTRLQ